MSLWMIKDKTRIISRSDFLALLFLIATVLWFNAEIAVGSKVPFFRDLGTSIYPMRFNLAQSLQASELPLWNRHVAMGFPFLSNPQAGVFYPPHIAFLLMPLFDAIRFLFVFHYLVAAAGSYFLFRHWNYPPYLSTIGSILFAFSGIIVSLSNLIDHFQGAVWIPLVLLLGEKSLRSASRKDFLLHILVSLVQFLAGSPEVYAVTIGLLFLDGLRLKGENTGIAYRRLFFFFLGSISFVAGIAMVQVLPTIELFFQSWRSETIPYSNVSVWSLQPLRLVNLFFLDKEVNLDAYNGLNLFFSRELPLILSLYMGSISLFGICLWFVIAPSKERVILSGLVITSLTLAMGRHTPVHPYLSEYVPLAGVIRFPEKIFLFTFALLLFILLRGLYEFLGQNRLSSKRSFAILLSISIPWLILYAFCRSNTDSLVRFIAWITQTSTFAPSTLKNAAGVIFHLERQVYLTFGIFILLFLWKMGRLKETLFRPLIVGLVLTDLVLAHRSYLFALDPSRILGNPKIISAPDPELHRLVYVFQLSDLNPSTYVFTKRPFAGMVSSAFATLIPNVGVFYGFDYMQELNPFGRKPYNLFLKAAHQLSSEGLYRLLGALNVKYIISFQSLPNGEITLIRHFPEHPSWLYRLNRTVPRAYIASKTMEEKEPLKILERLSSAKLDPHESVILEQPLSTPTRENLQTKVEIVHYTNQEVIIRASLDGSGILVLADSFYPGWRAYVDGKEEEILRANLFFRAVPLSLGEHLIEFRYQPQSFTIGIIISLITLSCIVIWPIDLFIVNGKRALLRKVWFLGR
ncbi:MAG: YfhO family protein [bacterium]